jgi:molybdate transport system substrate-binding protein
MRTPLADYGFREAALMTVSLWLGCLGCRSTPDRDEIVALFAAASLTEPFTELGHAFETTHPDVQLEFNFAGSQQLALQISNGARADVFVSADTVWMRNLLDRDMVQSPQVCCYNALVLITPRSNPAHLAELRDLSRPGIMLVVGAENVPVGRYTRQALRRASTLDAYPVTFAQSVIANVVSEEENVKAVVAKVRLGEADAGIVYRSDVTAPVRDDVTVINLPDALHVVAVYPMAVVSAARNPRVARAFVEFVRSAVGRAILIHHGLATEPFDSASAH